MGTWSFLTNHARALLHITADPDTRLRDIAVALGVTERTAYAIVTDLCEEGYLVKQKDGRRNRYQVQAHLTVREPVARERTIGELVALFAATDDGGLSDSRPRKRPEGRPEGPKG